MLTGKRRFRVGKKGRLILQVEYTTRSYDPTGMGVDGPVHTEWRDAKVDDITEHEFVNEH